MTFFFFFVIFLEKLSNILLEWSDILKTTGVIRRIDDLGRIVIPKEIRKSMRIKNGDSLEILVDEDSVILKKYSPIESVEDAAFQYASAFNQFIKHSIIITDRDKVIAASGPLKKKYLNKDISDFTVHSIERRDSFVERQKKSFSFVKDIEEFGYYSFSSIVNNGDAIGGVIIISNEVPIIESEEKMAVILSKLLSKNFIDE